jgi:16S rRNA (adenine1518-N6/adenine1519-N6)-dimethyltransferase
VQESNDINSNVLYVKRLLRASGTVAKKRMGQNFLVDESILKTILDASDISDQDVIVEIGPGLGILTEKLAASSKRVIAIELDHILASFLTARFGESRNVDIINEDILKADFSIILEKFSEYKIVANLPYNITSPVLHKIIYSRDKPKLIVVMVQKEVAENITASAGNLSAFAISLGIFTSARIVGFVKAKSFYPVPKVDSAILRFDFLSQPRVNVSDIDSFMQFVRCGFRAPRKQIRNSLAQGLCIEAKAAEEILLDAKIDLKMRPEALDYFDWKKLYEVTKEAGIEVKC